MSHQITEQEILDAQQAWGEGIVKIGNVFKAKEITAQLLKLILINSITMAKTVRVVFYLNQLLLLKNNLD